MAENESSQAPVLSDISNSQKVLREDEVGNWSDEELESNEDYESNQSNHATAVPETSVARNDPVPKFDENEPQLV